MKTAGPITSRPNQFGRVLAAASLFLLLQATSAFPAVYYVATNGSDTNTGTFASPFATVQQGQQAAAPGDTVYIRGGTYVMSESQIAKYVTGSPNFAYMTYLDKSGTSTARINYWAYPGERPIFDLSNIKPANNRVDAFYVKGSWLHFKGLEVVGVQVTILTHTQSICFENVGSNNIFEMLSMHDGQAIGFYLTQGSNNLVLNCDAYRNWDYTSETGKGGNVDGFGGHPNKKGYTGNVFRGCRAWFNSDDGFDCINAWESVTFYNCWAFYNGYSTTFASLGDGNGFKGGGYGKNGSTVPNPVPRHLIQFCLAVKNKASGFYSNHHVGGSDWFNNTAYRNGTNFNMLSTLSDNLTDVPGYGHNMKNNLGYLGGTEVSNLNMVASDVNDNYFKLTPAVTATASDFVSLDESLLTAPRQANGDLPIITFAQLAAGSDLIDKGRNIGFPFVGTAPDLGAFEYGLYNWYCQTNLSADRSGDCQIDFMDFALLATQFGTTSTIFQDLARMANQWLQCSRSPADQCWAITPLQK